MTERYAYTIDWLLASEEPWVVYNTLVDVLEKQNSPETAPAYADMQTHPKVASLLAELETWPTEKPLSKAYDPKDAIWKLAMLAEFGLRRDEERIAKIAEQVLAAQAEDGGFLQGGFDHTKTWHTRPYICISHVMTYSLARFGYMDDPCLQHAYDHIAAWQRLDGGWHPNKLNLPGNEREGEPSCPFGTLNVLRAVVENPDLRDSEIAQRAADYLLTCWERRAEPYRPVGFGIGGTWDKLQYPLVQYQLLKEVDTLSRVPSLRNDPRYLAMLETLESKQDNLQRWTAESVNKPYADFDFGQKKEPSPWLTLLAVRAIIRSI